MKILVLASVLCLVLTAFSQTNSSSKNAVGQVRGNTPTVYLEYVCQDKKNIRLRLNNNTIWILAVSADELYYKTEKTVKLANGIEFYTMPNNKEVSLQYRVDKFALPEKNVKVPKIAYSDSSNTNWIASADSILFSVPNDYLKEDLKITVRFNYEWEVSKDGVIVSGPEHTISFRGIDLNEKLPCESK
jgi:hypothetical protein